MQNIFSEIKGKDASQLHKVTADMKAKNQDGRSSKVAGSAGGHPTGASQRRSIIGIPQGAAKLALEDNMWRIENQEASATAGEWIKVSEGTMRQAIHVRCCKDVNIEVSCKVNSIIIESCAAVNIKVQDLVSGAEVVNCEKIKLQVDGSIPSLAIDKTTGFDLYLMKHSGRAVKLTTSMSSGMNLNFPESEAADAEFIERPIPEQFQSTINAKGTLDTSVSDLYSC
eukprot:GHVT01078658.1.p1 GENE.GHVT01078658.1~~GHVT01078658.1.p1  ORF type:complete len:226 (+),score=44.08 GHVT01078658.1:157-834(+)